MSFTGDYYMVQIVKDDYIKRYPKMVPSQDTIAENKTYREQRILEFNGHKPYKFKYSG